MLIRFNVENFLSFYEKAEFTMIAGKNKDLESHLNVDGLKLVKGSLIYGANGAGKSNFIKSVDFSKRCILKGLKEIDTVGKNYRLAKGSQNEKTEFEFEIKIDSKIYAYGFNLNLLKKEILEEWLYKVDKKKDILIYERKGFNIKTNFKILNFNKKDKLRYEVGCQDIKSNELLLTDFGNINFKAEENILKKIYEWFLKKLIIVFPNSEIYLNYLFNEFSKVKKYLTYFDTGITGISFVERKLKDLTIPNDKRIEISNIIANIFKKNSEKVDLTFNLNDIFYKVFFRNDEIIAKEIKFKHNNNDDEEFSLSEESDGTRRILEIIPLLELIKEKEVVLLIDEIERSLHPVLVRHYLEKLYDSVANNNSQFIITTHESRLINLNDVRRDEIWFANRNSEKGTYLKSLNDFNIRKDCKADKAYLLGRFGGIPDIMNVDFCEGKFEKCQG